MLDHGPVGLIVEERRVATVMTFCATICRIGLKRFDSWVAYVGAGGAVTVFTLNVHQVRRQFRAEKSAQASPFLQRFVFTFKRFPGFQSHNMAFETFGVEMLGYLPECIECMAVSTFLPDFYRFYMTGAASCLA